MTRLPVDRRALRSSRVAAIDVMCFGDGTVRLASGEIITV
jgi:hypothetical protein